MKELNTIQPEIDSTNFEKNIIFQCGKNSYISKEKFVEMINNLDFKAIERADIHFITNAIVKTINNESIVKTFGYDINIC